jgi:deoxycytidine triphosphate deaminase
MRLWRRRRRAAHPLPPNLQRNVDFPGDRDEALRRYARYRSDDPFPDIPPALLNSADIADYVATTGMIHPFYPEGLKPASYEVSLLGDAVYWDEEGRKHIQTISRGDAFVLRQNAIAFVTLEPEFHLPDYIALRFNLKIPNVYRGLLLGTGPLIDPGWAGHLSIPLHNLTTNEYTFRGGEPLIWMEFTKLSPNERWANRRRDISRRRGVYSPFPEDKRYGSVETRLASAAPNMPVSSSLATALASAHDAANTSRSLTRRITWGGIIGLVFGLATIVALAVDIIFFERTQSAPASQPTQVRPARVNALQREITDLQRRLRVLEAQRKP